MRSNHHPLAAGCALTRQAALLLPLQHLGIVVRGVAAVPHGDGGGAQMPGSSRQHTEAQVRVVAVRQEAGHQAHHACAASQAGTL